MGLEFPIPLLGHSSVGPSHPGQGTCDIGHPKSFLVLGRFGAVLVALLGPCRAGAAQMDLRGLKEGHHEWLLVLGSVSPDEACQLGVDALP